MKILFLSQRFLFPMDTGGKIRTGKILEQLSRAHELTVVGNFEPANDAPYLSAMQARGASRGAGRRASTHDWRVTACRATP